MPQDFRIKLIEGYFIEDYNLDSKIPVVLSVGIVKYADCASAEG